MKPTKFTFRDSQGRVPIRGIGKNKKVGWESNREKALDYAKMANATELLECDDKGNILNTVPIEYDE